MGKLLLLSVVLLLSGCETGEPVINSINHQPGSGCWVLVNPLDVCVVSRKPDGTSETKCDRSKAVCAECGPVSSGACNWESMGPSTCGVSQESCEAGQ